MYSESDEPIKPIRIVDVPFSFTFAMYSPDSNKMSNLMRCYITQIYHRFLWYWGQLLFQENQSRKKTNTYPYFQLCLSSNCYDFCFIQDSWLIQSDQPFFGGGSLNWKELACSLIECSRLRFLRRFRINVSLKLIHFWFSKLKISGIFMWKRNSLPCQHKTKLHLSFI